MAKLNLDYYNGEDQYSDGGVEEELLSMYENGGSSTDFLANDSRWPVWYHLSHIRKNILNWYPFKQDANILEVGAGCGALTGLLSDKAKHVTSVELTKRRASINYLRNKDKKNLEVIAGNFHHIPLKPEYDYIVLNGVLEYAGSFTEGKDPYAAFLQQLGTLLKPGGIILIAIENRIGLKYLNGAPEDHANRLFTGVEDYNQITAFRTFTRSELKETALHAGFEHSRFYYPTPDYKFPKTVYTDKTLNMMDSSVVDPAFNANRLSFYPELETLTALKEEGVVGSFLNSFFVEISKQELQSNDNTISYAKMSYDRKRRFAIATLIPENGSEVIKRPISAHSAPHLKAMAAYYKKHPKIHGLTNVPMREQGEDLYFPWVKGPELLAYLLTAAEQKDKEGFVQIIKKYRSKLISGTQITEDYCTPAFAEVFGEQKLTVPMHCMKDSNIDLIFSNILVAGAQNTEDIGVALDTKSWTVIDYEWTFPFEIPQEFVIWRALYLLYMQNSAVQNLFTLEALMEEAGLTQEACQTFLKWHDHFNDDYVTNKIFGRYLGTTVDLSGRLNGIYGDINPVAKLYADDGQGFSEAPGACISAKAHLKADGIYLVSFNLDELTGSRHKMLRFDPSDGGAVFQNMRILAPQTQNDLILCPENGVAQENAVVFYENDPHYCVLGDYENLHTITIQGQMFPLNEYHDEQVATITSGLLSEAGKAKELRARNEALTQKLTQAQNLQTQLNAVQADLASVTGSTIWRSTALLRKLADKIKAVKHGQ